MRRNKISIKKVIQKKIEYRQKSVVSGRKVVEKTKTVEETPKKINKTPTKDVDMNDMNERIKRRLGVQTEPINVDLVDTQLKISNNISELIVIENRVPISIIVTAYQTQDYIEECLDSIEKQTYFDGFNNYEVLVGVDGCEKTLNKLLKIRHKYRNLHIFMMESNMGTFITSNTLLELINYENVLRFDSDDIMLPHMINNIFYNLDNFDVIRFKFNNLVNNSLLKSNMYAFGCIFFKKHIYIKHGGYQPWKCAADGDFLNRISENKILLINKILFNRRIHKNNLTKRIDTGMKSQLRMKYRKLTLINKNNNINNIKTITNNYVKY